LTWSTLVAAIFACAGCDDQQPRKYDLAATHATLLRMANKWREDGTPEEGFVVERLELAAESIKALKSLETPRLLWADLGLTSVSASPREGILCMNWIEGTSHASGFVLQLGEDKATRVILPAFEQTLYSQFIPNSWTVRRIQVRIEMNATCPALVAVVPTAEMPSPYLLVIPAEWVNLETESTSEAMVTRIQIRMISTQSFESNGDQVFMYSLDYRGNMGTLPAFPWSPMRAMRSVGTCVNTASPQRSRNK